MADRFAETSSKRSSDTAFCERCGTQTDTAANFCSACGADQRPPAQALGRDVEQQADPPISSRSLAVTEKREAQPIRPSASSMSRPFQHVATSGDLQERIDLRRYRDLSERITVISTEGGGWIRGARGDLPIVDGEPEMRPGEREVGRYAGATTLAGLVASDESTATPGFVMKAATILIVTSHRLIVMGIGGESALGQIQHGAEVHALAWPWDLTDMISVPAKVRLADRIAGSRTIEIFGASTFTTIRFVPKFVEDDGGRKKLDADDAFRLLARTAAAHRLSVSDESEHGRLRDILIGRIANEGGEYVAYITADNTPMPPPHLRERLAD